MSRPCFVLLASLSVVCMSTAQVTWERIYGVSGFNVGFSVIEGVYHSGFLVVGAKSSPGGEDIHTYLMKVSSNGDIIWERTYSLSENWDIGVSVIELMSGYVLAGCADYGDEDRMFLMKVNDAGDTLWTRVLPGKTWDDMAAFIKIKDFAGIFVITGVLVDTLTGTRRAYVVCTDTNGFVLWSREYGEGYALDAAICYDGISITGLTILASTPGMSYIRLINVNIWDGTPIWERSYEDSAYFGKTIECIPYVGYIISATRENSSYDKDVAIIKTDLEGNIEWTKSFGGNSYDWGLCAKPATDSGFVFLGVYNAGDDILESESGEVILAKCDAYGDTLWTKIFGPNELNIGWSVSSTTDGGYIFVGWTGSYATGVLSIYLVKTDALGNVSWVREVSQSGRLLAFEVAPTPFNSSCVISASAGSDVEIYDANGRLIWSSPAYGTSGNDAWRGYLSPRKIVWTPDESVKSGVYFVRATIGGQTKTRRVVLMR